MWFCSNHRSTPTWARPSAPPPSSTRPMVGRWGAGGSEHGLKGKQQEKVSRELHAVSQEPKKLSISGKACHSPAETQREWRGGLRTFAELQGSRSSFPAKIGRHPGAQGRIADLSISFSLRPSFLQSFFRYV